MKTPNNKTRTRGEQETETTCGNSYIHFNLQFVAKAALICEQVRSLNFFKEHSPFSLFALVLPSLHFFASFLPPPYLFLAVSPSSLNRSSPLQSEYGVNSLGHVNRLWPVRASVFFFFRDGAYNTAYALLDPFRKTAFFPSASRLFCWLGNSELSLYQETPWDRRERENAISRLKLYIEKEIQWDFSQPTNLAFKGGIWIHVSKFQKPVIPNALVSPHLGQVP